jgi:predicted DNA-binding transcriptional regulator AlpA
MLNLSTQITNRLISIPEVTSLTSLRKTALLHGYVKGRSCPYPSLP